MTIAEFDTETLKAGREAMLLSHAVRAFCRDETEEPAVAVIALAHAVATIAIETTTLGVSEARAELLGQVARMYDRLSERK